MAPSTVHLWENKVLLTAVYKAMSLFCPAFNLDPVRASHYDFDQAIATIGRGNLAPEDRERLEQIGTQEPEFYQDIVAQQKIPRSWITLHRSIYADYRAILVEKAKNALKRSHASNPPTLNAVVDASESLLFWKIVLGSKALNKQLETGTFWPWLDWEAEKAVDRFADPSWMFHDWDRLLLVGRAWEKYRVDAELPKAQGCTRGRIAAKRQEVPLPLEIQEFERDLYDRNKARELHAPVGTAVYHALRYWPLINEGRAVPEYDLVRHELLDRLIWQAIKNGATDEWERREGATSWLPHLVPRANNALLMMALQSTNTAAGLPANHNLQKFKLPDPDAEPEPPPAGEGGTVGNRGGLLGAAIVAMHEGQMKEILIMSLGYDEASGIGLSEEEMAAKLKIDVKVVQKQLRAARKWLKDRLHPPERG